MSDTLKFELSKCDKPTSSIELNRAAVQAIVDEIAGLERSLSEETRKGEERLKSLQYVFEQLAKIQPDDDDNRPIEKVARLVVARHQQSKLDALQLREYAVKIEAPAKRLVDAMTRWLADQPDVRFEVVDDAYRALRDALVHLSIPSITTKETT